MEDSSCKTSIGMSRAWAMAWYACTVGVRDRVKLPFWGVGGARLELWMN